ISTLPDIGPSLIKGRIHDAIMEWVSAADGTFNKASERITENCMKLQSKINARIGKLNTLELGFSFLKGSGQVESPSSDDTGIMSNMGITIALASSPIWMKVARVAHVVGLIPGFNRIINRLSNGNNKALKKMSKTTEKAVNTLVSEKRLKQFITDSFTSHYCKWLNALNQDAAHIISSTRACIVRIDIDLHANINSLHLFKTLQTMLNECSNRLHELEKAI
ncbi:hypothetical protein ACJMK2_029744, partial [Sinanodonta woodiana]